MSKKNRHKDPNKLKQKADRKKRHKKEVRAAADHPGQCRWSVLLRGE